MTDSSAAQQAVSPVDAPVSERHIAELRSRTAQLGAEVGELRDLLRESEEENARLREELARARADAERFGSELEQTLASSSWRVTAPLRAIRGRF